MADLCKPCSCMGSVLLIDMLIDRARDSVIDEERRRWVPGDLERIKRGLTYLENNCGIPTKEAQSIIQQVIEQYKKNEWHNVNSNLLELLVKIHATIEDCAGWKWPRLPF